MTILNQFISNTNKPKRWISYLTFFTLFAVALIIRLYLLITTQHFLDGDESLVGLMAKHILENGEHPLFWYGLHYNGGGSWEAHLGALMLQLFGYSDISLKLVALVFSLGILVFLYFWVKENFGFYNASFTIFFYVFSTSFVSWNLKLRGHLTLVFCIVFLLWLFFRFLFQHKRGLITTALTGLASGLGYWCLESSVMLTFVFLLFWFHEDRRILLRRRFWLFSTGFITGIIPNIYENIRYNFANIRHLFLRQEEFGSRTFTEKAYLTITHDLPALFHSDIVHNYPAKIEWWAWISYFVVSITIIYFIIKIGPKCYQWIVGFFKQVSRAESSSETYKYIFILVYLILYQLSFSLTGYAQISPRYMLPILPLIYLILAMFMTKLINTVKYVGLVFVLAFAIWWGFIGIKDTICVANNYTVIDGFTPSDGRDMIALTKFLERKQIKTAYANKFIKFRVIFYSKENIIVSRFINERGGIVGIPPISLYPEYEKTVEKSRQPAYIFGNEQEVIASFEDFLRQRAIGYKVDNIGNSYYLYYNFDNSFHCGSFIHHLQQDKNFWGKIWKIL